jgi:hypothetical protein
MAIPSRQIGWSGRANLLWQISKQLEYLTCVAAGGCTTTTTTTTIIPTTTTTTTICVEFINSIIISNGSYGPANGTYTRDTPSESFTLTEGDGAIFFGGDAWYIFNGTIGNVAINTSTLGTGTWEPFAPGNSSGITAEYSSYICPTTTTTTTTAPLVFTKNTFVNCADPCPVGCLVPFNYFSVWMSQDCIDNWPQVGCQVFLDIEGSIGGPFPTGTYNNGNGFCIYIEDGVVI